MVTLSLNPHYPSFLPMAAARCFSENLSRPTFLMATLSPNLRSKPHFFPAILSPSPTFSLRTKDTHRLLCSTSKAAILGLRARARVPDAQLKENWLDSLSCPFPEADGQKIAGEDGARGDSGSEWVIGIDPDASGAVALLKPDKASGFSAQVFDTPYLQVLVGKQVRKRLDARSIARLLHSFGAPIGTKAYIEQSLPFPQDGKQGWWSGGFTYGLWIGILVASGFSVIPVSSRLWKDHFELYRNSSTKDDSRTAASILFPYLSTSLKRKKDHGRAEALLIAAYGRNLMNQPSPSAL